LIDPAKVYIPLSTNIGHFSDLGRYRILRFSTVQEIWPI